MDSATIASAATQLSNIQLQQQAGISVLKKAIDVQSQGAMALLQALPQPTPVSALPDNLGRNINITA